MKIKIPHEVSLKGTFTSEEIKTLNIPARVDAHQTITGWALFKMHNSLIGEGKLDRYSIAIIDSHEGKTTLETSVVKELKDVQKDK